MRPLLLVSLALAAVAAGCAEGPGTEGAPLATPSPLEAQALFAQAAGNVPERYGIDMTMTKDGRELMGADAAFDEAAKTGFFRIRMDPSLMEDAGGAEFGMMPPGGEIVVYTSAQGTAIQLDDNVMLAPPEEGDEPSWMSGAGDSEGFEALTDPEALFEELREENVSITSVTPTTIRGKAALKLDATFNDEDGRQNATIYLFQDPTRVARIEMVAPADEEQFAGALMTMDMLYDDEIEVVVPDGLKRVLGLRYESDRSFAFGFGGSMGSGEEEHDNVETWTFQVDGGIALADVEAQVGDAMVDPDAEAAWTMTLTEGSKTVEGLTLTFTDADNDGTVSAGDTLAITRGEGSEGAQVALKDKVSGLRVTPGAGALLAALAAIGAALVSRRR